MSPSDRIRVIALWAALAATACRAEAPPYSARLQVDRDGLYVGEPFVLTLTLSTSEPSLSRSIQALNLPPPDQLRLERFEEMAPPSETGTNILPLIRTFRARATLLTDQPVTIHPQLVGSVESVQQTLFMVTRSQRMVTIPLTPLLLQARPLPSGAPAAFDGAIGEFRVSAQADTNTLAPGDLVTLTYTVAGDGDLGTAGAPRLTATHDFKCYPPERLANGTANRATFRQVVIPLHTNATPIPPADFSFFDARAGRYETRHTDPIALAFVAAGSNRPVYEPPPALRSPQAPDAAGPALQTGLLPVPGPDSADRVRRTLRRPLFWIAQALAPAGVVVMWLVSARRRKVS